MIITERIKAKKEEKKNSLLNTAFKLFLDKGIQNTSIDDITKNSRIAKGTFYLYFKDKYEVQEELIVRESKKLFDNALLKANTKKFKTIADELIFIIDDVIEKLTKNKILLKFISKNLSWGVYNEKLNKIAINNSLNLEKTFMQRIKKYNVKLKNPKVTLYMITELSGSTLFSSILYGKPLPIKRYKPYLYDEIRKMLNN